MAVTYTAIHPGSCESGLLYSPIALPFHAGHDRPPSASKSQDADECEDHRSAKRRHHREDDGGTKRGVILKEGKIAGGDKFLMDLAREIGGKWEEVGVALGVGFKALKSVMSSEGAKSDHMKAFYMLQEWSDRAAENFTYEMLASALESAGLNTCAHEHCYTPSDL